MERRGKTRDGREILLTEAHRYFVGGKEKIANGKLLEVSGLKADFENNKNPHRDDWMEFGSAVHEWAEVHLLKRRQDFPPVPDIVEPYLAQIDLWLSMTGAIVRAVETPRYSELLDCCTTPDLEVEIPKELNDWPAGDWTIELKRGIPYPHYRYQTAIESLAIRPTGDCHRGALYLDGGHNIPKLEVHGDPADFDVVIACATLYHEKRRRGIL